MIPRTKGLVRVKIFLDSVVNFDGNGAIGAANQEICTTMKLLDDTKLVGLFTKRKFEF
jgi:hypothetical protein